MRGVASETSVSVMRHTWSKRNAKVFFLLQHLGERAPSVLKDVRSQFMMLSIRLSHQHSRTPMTSSRMPSVSAMPFATAS